MKWAVTLAVAAATVFLVQAACPSGFFQLTDPSTLKSLCIYVTPSKATWYSTREMCKLLGADLAKLNEDMHGQMMIHIKNDPGLTDEAFWIGGTDVESEGSWKWVDNTPIPLGTPHWYPCNNQPNGGTKQNYLCLYTPDFYFHSLEGTRMIRGICATVFNNSMSLVR